MAGLWEMCTRCGLTVFTDRIHRCLPAAAKVHEETFKNAVVVMRGDGTGRALPQPMISQQGSNAMVLHNVWAVQNPTPIEQQAGGTPTLVLEMHQVLARDPQHAIAIVFAQESHTFVSLDMARVVPFAKAV